MHIHSAQAQVDGTRPFPRETGIGIFICNPSFQLIWH